jgi:copper chaperone CopZ
MTTPKLHRHHHTVVHSSTNRTRLRVPKSHRSHAHLLHAKKAIENLPGVSAVEVNPETGSLLIHHEDRPDILTEVSAALQESAPEILAALLIPGIGEADLGIGVLSSLVKRCVIEPLSGSAQNKTGANGGFASTSESYGIDFPAGNKTIRRMLPLAFVAAGTWKLLQEEALLAGLAPIACFYYGFDLYWKFRQENVEARIEETTEQIANKPVSKQGNRAAVEHS